MVLPRFDEGVGGPKSSHWFNSLKKNPL
jgi:hypothetical protein